MEYLIVCIGNIKGGDDAVGPYIADKLKKDFTVINCGTVPENYTSVIKNHNPKNLIIIDAIKMGLNPGEIRIVPKEKIGVMHISTHGIPLSILIDYLNQYVENIFLIGIQPKRMSGSLSDIVHKSADILIDIIKNKQLKQIKKLT